MHGVLAFSSGVRVSGPRGFGLYGGRFLCFGAAAKPSAAGGAGGWSDPDGFDGLPFPPFGLVGRLCDCTGCLCGMRWAGFESTINSCGV